MIKVPPYQGGTPRRSSRLRPSVPILSCVVLVLALLVIGCFSPPAPPSRGAVPFSPRPSAADLFGPDTSVTTLPPLSIPGPGAAGLLFPWKPASFPRAWRYIVLHHTASSTGSVESINSAHEQRTDAGGNSWRGIGYHFVIGNGNGMGDGAIEPTFRWQEQSSGAHAGVAEYNEWGIGICLVGNFEDAPPSTAQIAAITRLVGELKAEYGIETANVLRHGDLKATACPGKFFPHAEVAASTASRAGPGRR